jgi:hypothetical protein
MGSLAAVLALCALLPALSAGGPLDELAASLRVVRISVAQLSATETAASAQIEIRNPLPTDLRVESVRYQLRSGRHLLAVGTGRGFVLHPSRVSRIELPIRVAPLSLLGAAGPRVLLGGTIPGLFVGELVVRLPGGERHVSFSLPHEVRIL